MEPWRIQSSSWAGLKSSGEMEDLLKQIEIAVLDVTVEYELSMAELRAATFPKIVCLFGLDFVFGAFSSALESETRSRFSH